LNLSVKIIKYKNKGIIKKVMKSLTNLKKVLGEIEITEEQQSALNEFFEELSSSIEERVTSELQSEISIKDDEIEELKSSSNTEGLISIEEAEMAFNLFKEDSERAFNKLEEDAENAFNLFKEDAEGAFNKLKIDSEQAFALFESDAESAFDLFMEEAETAGEMMSEDLKNVYAEKSMKAIEDLYESIEGEVKSAFLESEEYRALMEIKKIATPFVLEESDDELAKKIVSLSSQKETLFEEVESLKKKEIISSLISDFPVKQASIIQEFIEKGRDENEIYERFSTVIELLEEQETKGFNREEELITSVNESTRTWKKPENKSGKINFQNFINENKNKKIKPKKTEIYTEAKKYTKKTKVTPFFESHSVEPKEAPKKKTLALPAHEQKIMDQVFGN
jgi:hypothetical protein